MKALRASLLSGLALCFAAAVLAQSEPAELPVSWYAATVAEADKMLKTVAQTGYPNARIIID